MARSGKHSPFVVRLQASERKLLKRLATHTDDPAVVVAGIETDRGLLVVALYRVHAINPLAASRYRERHTTSRAKSDRGDARVLAEVARTDRHHHRQVAGDSAQAEAVKVLARAHQSLIWTRQQQAQQRFRAEQATDDWRRRYALRCGVESLSSQASRRTDLHHARYRGLAKTHLQHVLTALALNLVRVDG